MRRSITTVVVAGALIVAAVGGVAVGQSRTSQPVADLEYVVAVSGDSYFGLSRDLGLSCNGTALWAANGRAPLDPGTIVFVPPSCKTTTPPTTTVPPVTVPPTTQPPVTTPPTTTPPVTPAGFVETFDGNTGLDRFDTGIYHRGDLADGTITWPLANLTWPGDHDMACGDPTSTS